jgi:hypothetical protein
MKIKKVNCHYIIHLKVKNKDAYWHNNRLSILNFEPYLLDGDINWLDDPHKHRSWRWLLNNFKWADTLIYDYIYKKNNQSIKLTVEYFFSWYKFYITDKRFGEYLWKDDAVSFRAFRFSVIIDYIINSIEYNQNQKKDAINALKLHYNELINSAKFKMNNHGVFQIRALLTLTYMHSNILDHSTAEKYAENKLNELWLRQYGNEGVHLENSTAYHQIIIREFQEILQSEEAKNLKLIFKEEEIQMVIENTKFFYHPNGCTTLFGDTNFNKKQIPIYQEEKHFKEAGYLIKRKSCLNKEDSYIAIRTGFPSNIHRHSDDFSFEWSEDSQIILQDSGRYSYDYDDPFRVYISSTRAHNTITVNESNFPWWGRFNKSDFYTSAVNEKESNDERLIVKLNKKFREPDVFFERKITLIHGESLEIIDFIKSDNECNVEQWFHLNQDFQFEGLLENNIYLFSSNKINLEVKNIGGEAIDVVKGRISPSIQGWVSYSERTKIPRWSIGFFKDNSNTATISTIFKIKKKNS